MGKTSWQSKQKYNNKAYDRIHLTVPKGEKEIIKAHADKYDNKSVNGFIQRAIKETMQRDIEKMNKL